MIECVWIWFWGFSLWSSHWRPKLDASFRLLTWSS